MTLLYKFKIIKMLVSRISEKIVEKFQHHHHNSARHKEQDIDGGILEKQGQDHL